MPKENSQVMKNILDLAANGNAQARLCLDLAVTFFHNSDDIIDCDMLLTVRELTKYNNMLARLFTCEFFKQFSGILMVQMALIGDDYAASEESPEWIMLRHCGNNFVRTIALLTGGEDLMVRVSKMLRDYSIKDQYTSTNILSNNVND